MVFSTFTVTEHYHYAVLYFFPLGFLGFIHPEFYLICLTITNIF